MDEASAHKVPSTGLKRRADLALEHSHSPQKKSKGQCLQESIEEPDALDSASSATSDSASDDDEPHPLAPTPQTQFSSEAKASPRFPSDRKVFHCPYDACSKSFNRPARLNDHLRSHTDTRPFTCPHAPCSKAFLRDTHLNHHIKSAHSTVRDYLCDWKGCGKRFVTGTRLRRHKAAHEGREKYKCEDCGLDFRKHGTLQKHITLVHEGNDPFVCEVVVDCETGEKCGMGYETLGKLRAHEGRVHAEKRYWCMVCSSEAQVQADVVQAAVEGMKEAEAGFTTYESLQAHVKLVHPPTCASCGLRCGSSRELTRHLEVVHGGQPVSARQTHLCTDPSCGRGFTRKGNLMVHMRTVHGNEKRFVCGEVEPSSLSERKIAKWDGKGACGRAFQTKANLEEHVRTAHLGLQNSRKGREKRRGWETGEEEQQLMPPRSSKPAVSVLTRLTGCGYADQSGRDIPCLQAGCEYRFLRHYDLEVHLRTKHGFADEEIQELLLQRDSGNSPTDSSWFRNSLDFQPPIESESEAGRGLDGSLIMGVGMTVDFDLGINSEIKGAPAAGAELWLGDGETYADQGMADGDNWWRDEAETQQWIRGDEEIDMVRDEAMIDPALRA
ncbi:MAG: hypothetical protein FRX48_00177 [Lasallia pustulata]|uniref:C2H2-type domain-containing protein n=1 Tax=Lasallia pustulata TaxID=136370 RepID=A0A5M8Q178_9LECA|nr:MAG: hypothetical protein FRX48_00177 [Lasallia pustulata]